MFHPYQNLVLSTPISKSLIIVFPKYVNITKINFKLLKQLTSVSTIDDKMQCYHFLIQQNYYGKIWGR